MGIYGNNINRTNLNAWPYGPCRDRRRIIILVRRDQKPLITLTFGDNYPTGGFIMKKLIHKAKLGYWTIIASITGSAPAFAAIDLTGVSVDKTDYIAIAAFLIAALVAFWGIKKGMGLFYK